MLLLCIFPTIPTIIMPLIEAHLAVYLFGLFLVALFFLVPRIVYHGCFLVLSLLHSLHLVRCLLTLA